ncbi:MAG: cupin domain-containing protein [Actinomycetota bacterium]|nr:cupin domain-containing protein [Actinomycetota bacterium]
MKIAFLSNLRIDWGTAMKHFQAALGSIALVASIAFGAPAHATPGSGLTITPIVNGHYGTLQVNTEGDKTGKWGMILKTLDDSDIGSSRVVVEPQGVGGWHSHPAPNFITVVRGTIEWVDSTLCTVRVLHAGDSLMEPAYRAHNARNPAPIGGEVAEIIDIRIKPSTVVGPAFRIDEPVPNNCNF